MDWDGERIRYGDEDTHPKVLSAYRFANVVIDTAHPLLPQCVTCNVDLGEYHVPGCSIEKCPACGWQAIACWCDDPVDGHMDIATGDPEDDPAPISGYQIVTWHRLGGNS